MENSKEPRPFICGVAWLASVLSASIFLFAFVVHGLYAPVFDLEVESSDGWILDQLHGITEQQNVEVGEGALPRLVGDEAGDVFFETALNTEALLESTFLGEVERQQERMQNLSMVGASLWNASLTCGERLRSNTFVWTLWQRLLLFVGLAMHAASAFFFWALVRFSQYAYEVGTHFIEKKRNNNNSNNPTPAYKPEPSIVLLFFVIFPLTMACYVASGVVEVGQDAFHKDDRMQTVLGLVAAAVLANVLWAISFFLGSPVKLKTTEVVIPFLLVLYHLFLLHTATSRLYEVSQATLETTLDSMPCVLAIPSPPPPLPLPPLSPPFLPSPALPPLPPPPCEYYVESAGGQVRWENNGAAINTVIIDATPGSGLEMILFFQDALGMTSQSKFDVRQNSGRQDAISYLETQRSNRQGYLIVVACAGDCSYQGPPNEEIPLNIYASLGIDGYPDFTPCPSCAYAAAAIVGSVVLVEVLQEAPGPTAAFCVPDAPPMPSRRLEEEAEEEEDMFDQVRRVGRLLFWSCLIRGAALGTYVAEVFEPTERIGSLLSCRRRVNMANAKLFVQCAALFVLLYVASIVECGESITEGEDESIFFSASEDACKWVGLGVATALSVGVFLAYVCLKVGKDVLDIELESGKKNRCIVLLRPILLGGAAACAAVSLVDIAFYEDYNVGPRFVAGVLALLLAAVVAGPKLVRGAASRGEEGSSPNANGQPVVGPQSPKEAKVIARRNIMASFPDSSKLQLQPLLSAHGGHSAPSPPQ